MPIRHNTVAAAAIAGLSCCLCTRTNAAFIMNVYDTAHGTVVAGNGTINTASLSFFDSGIGYASVDPYLDQLISGPTSTYLQQTTSYTGVSGPSTLGPVNIFNGPLGASTGSGDLVGVIGPTTKLIIPTGYVSGSEMSDTCLFYEESISQIGLTDGTYVYSWGSGATADSLTINIGTPVPEPASAAAVALPATLALLRRRRRRSL